MALALESRPETADRTVPSRVAIVACVVGIVSIGMSRAFSVDAFFALTFGRFVAHHGLPHHNLFTAVDHGRPWIDQQWLSHLAFYGVWSAGGYAAVALLSVALIAAGFSLLYLVLVRNGVASQRAMWWTFLAYAGCITNTAVRPQSFAYVLFPAVLWLVLDDARSPQLLRRTWLVVPVLVVWANVHGSVLVGAAVVGVYSLWRLRASMRYLALGAAAAVAAFVTPYGTADVREFVRALRPAPWKHHVAEWGAPRLGDPFSWGFIAIAVVAAVVLGRTWRGGRRLPAVPVALSAITFLLALTTVRFGIWFCMVAPVAAALATQAPAAPSKPASRLALTTATVGLLLALGALVATPASQFELHTPRRALRAAFTAMAERPDAQLLGDEFSGTPALWLDPSLQGRVAYDIRFSQYGDAEMEALYDLLDVRGSHWDRALEGYDVVTVDRRAHGRLAGVLEHLSGWRVLSSDAVGVTVERV